MKCNICGDQLVEYFNLSNTYKYYKCLKCSLIARSPDSNVINYEDEYNDPGTIHKSKILANYYFKKFKDLIKDNSDCLEIGGSFGFFGDLLVQNKNCSVVNCEPSSFAAEYNSSSKVNFINDIDQIDNTRGFDYIFSFHVVEHIPASVVKEHFEKLSQLLKPGGRIFILTPNSLSFKFKLFKKNYPWLASDEHINFFSRQSLNLTLTPFGFTEEISKSCIPSYIHYPDHSVLSWMRKKLFSENLMKSNQINSQVEKPRNFISKLKSLFHSLMIVERIIFMPFYLLIDLFTKEHDEVFVIYKKD